MADLITREPDQLTTGAADPELRVRFHDNGDGSWSPTFYAAGSSTGGTAPTTAQMMAGRAATQLPTPVTDGQLVALLLDKFGRNVNIPFGVRELIGSQRTTISSSTAETTIVSAIAATFNDPFLLTFKNTSATAVRVDIRDTTAGTIIDDIYIPAGDTRGWAPARSLTQSVVNTNWTAQCSASVADVRVTAWYVKNK